MRRSLWTPLLPDTILDDVLAPMRCVLAGYRVVFNERARAFDCTAPDADAEAQRKIRTLAGNVQVLSLEPRLLLPWRNVSGCRTGRTKWVASRAVCADRAHGHQHRPCDVHALMRPRSPPSAPSTCWRRMAPGWSSRTRSAWAAVEESSMGDPALPVGYARDALPALHSMFLMMNCSAVGGLVAFLRGRKVWR